MGPATSDSVDELLFASAEVLPGASQLVSAPTSALHDTRSSPQDQPFAGTTSNDSHEGQSGGPTATATGANSDHNMSAYTGQILQLSLGAVADNSQLVVNSVKNYYQWLSSFADPRVETWPMMSSPMPTLSLFALYLIAANYGPTLMRTRKPLQLRWLLVVYNLYVSLLNLWIACELCYCSYKLRYRSMCQLVLITDDPYVMRIANCVWWYYASKGIEFADTLFFILRKKDRQLTFLHKYHHSSMFIVWWTAARFVPGGSAIIPIVVNSLVHVLMYAYYGLSALGPQIQRYLWWKRYLTQVQLVQFFIGVSIGIHLITSNCQFTRWMQYVFSCYAFSFIILFGNFYLNEYIKGRQQQHHHHHQQRQTLSSSSSSSSEEHKLTGPARRQNGVDKVKQT